MLQSRNLDDQSFEQIMEYVTGRLPWLCPAWTDYNAHDPGITILELIAWYKEMQQYHMNTMTPALQKKLLKLLGVTPRPPQPARCLVSLPQGRPAPSLTRLENPQGVCFELLEAARWLAYLKPDGQIVTSTQQIDPMPVITGAAQYPENLVEKMRAAGAKVDALDCLKLAEEAGSSKAVNIVLMGRLSHYFDLPEEAWQASLEAMVPPKFLELNKKAFQLGKNA